MRGRSRGRRDERGAALVEAALILPIMMIITFGAIELGIGYGQKGALASATRAGARRGSTQVEIATPQFGDDVAQAVNSALSHTAVPHLDALYIYKDGQTVVPGGGGSPVAYDPKTDGCDASHDCIQYPVDPTDRSQFWVGNATGSSGWPTTDRSACQATPDKIAIRVDGTFSFLTNLIGTGSVTLRSTSVLQFEPNGC